jgi:hypothetical protein
MRDWINAECVDCGTHRRIETLEAALAHVCPTCLVKRALDDYIAWCGAMDDIPDPDSADEYLYVTSYGSHLPGWAQAKVREFAAGLRR